jgi:hypothetical protein
MVNSTNKQAREKLTSAMKMIDIEINHTLLPLLNSSVSQIIIDVNDGEVAKVRPLYIIKK